MWLLKYMWIWRDYQSQGDTALDQYKELDLSPWFAWANSVALETGATGLVLTLIYTHELQGFHWEESLQDCGSGTFSAEGGTGIYSFTHRPVCKQQASYKFSHSRWGERPAGRVLCEVKWKRRKTGTVWCHSHVESKEAELLGTGKRMVVVWGSEVGRMGWWWPEAQTSGYEIKGSGNLMQDMMRRDDYCQQLCAIDLKAGKRLECFCHTKKW